MADLNKIDRDLDMLENELSRLQEGRIELWEQTCELTRAQITRINGRIAQCKELIGEGDPDGFFHAMINRLKRQRASLKRELQDNTKYLAEIKRNTVA